MGQKEEEVNHAGGEVQSHKCQTYSSTYIPPENIHITEKLGQNVEHSETDINSTNKHSLENVTTKLDKNESQKDFNNNWPICDNAVDDIAKVGQSENKTLLSYIEKENIVEVEYPKDNNKKEQAILWEWLQNLNKKLEFLYVHSTSELMLTDDIEKNTSRRVCDPYSFIENDKIQEVKNIDTEQIMDKIHGKCTVSLKNGDECEGNWRHGKRIGKGTMMGPTLEKLGISYISGSYENGVLTGLGRLSMLDNSLWEGWFQKGFLHGPLKGTQKNGQVSWVGWYQAGLAVGTCWQSVLGDGWLVGKVDKDGRMTGDDIAFLYPDLSTALVGRFEEGELVSAVPAVVDTVRLVHGVMEVELKKTGGPEYKHWLSTKEDIACPPHQGDMYERSRVEVKESRVEGAGEGLYARVDLAPGMVVAYYNGLRMKPGEGSLEEDTGFAIFIDWARTWQEKQNTEHMDIPSRYHATRDYSATLGHKVNHSFNPNMVFDVALHPCYGRIPALRTLRGVKAGEELCAHYTMDMGTASDWYRVAWQIYSTGGNQMEEIEKEALGDGVVSRHPVLNRNAVVKNKGGEVEDKIGQEEDRDDEQVELKEDGKQVDDRVEEQTDLRDKETVDLGDNEQVEDMREEQMDLRDKEQVGDTGEEQVDLRDEEQVEDSWRNNFT